MKEFGCCGNRLKQGPMRVPVAGFWLSLTLSSGFQEAEKIRELIRNIACNVKQLLSGLLLCFQKGRVMFWKTFTIVALLDWFYRQKTQRRVCLVPFIEDVPNPCFPGVCWAVQPLQLVCSVVLPDQHFTEVLCNVFTKSDKTLHERPQGMISLIFN